MNESVWLIDDGKLCLGICRDKLKWVVYTDEYALRFETAELANAFITKNKINGAKAVGHMFCPPHEWNDDGERCIKCGDKDWMT